MKTVRGRVAPFVRQWRRNLAIDDVWRVSLVVVLPAEPKCRCCQHEVAA